MTPSTHIHRLGTTLACALAAVAIGVPLAQAYTVVTENSATQNRVDSRNAYGPPDPWLYPFLHHTSSTGYRFITENSASQNRLPSEIVAARAVPAPAQRFDWLSAAIGGVAAAACGAILVLLTRTRLAFGGHRNMSAHAPTR
jgi:hypothetical protein